MHFNQPWRSNWQTGLPATAQTNHASADGRGSSALEAQGMRVLFDLVHPANSLVFFHTIRRLKQAGAEVRICSRHKDVLTAAARRVRFRAQAHLHRGFWKARPRQGAYRARLSPLAHRPLISPARDGRLRRRRHLPRRQADRDSEHFILRHGTCQAADRPGIAVHHRMARARKLAWAGSEREDLSLSRAASNSPTSIPTISSRPPRSPVRPAGMSCATISWCGPWPGRPLTTTG